MRSTFKILFYINRQKTKADGKTAIFCRVTIDGRSAVMATGEECLPTEWSSGQGLFYQLAENVIKLKPPIVITLEEANTAMDMLEASFEAVLRK